jgi:hypothetical protein
VRTKLDDLIVEKGLAYFDASKSNHLRDNISKIDKQLNNPNLLKDRILDMQEKAQELHDIRTEKENAQPEYEQMYKEDVRHRGKPPSHV